MRENVANKMLLVEDYQKIRTLHQLYLFVSNALFSSENGKSESENRFERVVHVASPQTSFGVRLSRIHLRTSAGRLVVHAEPSNVAFFA